MSRPHESPRKRSRAAALQVLFSLEFGGSKPDAAPQAEFAAAAGPENAVAFPGELDLARAQLAFDEVGAHFELPEGARVFAKELLFGVARHRRELDVLISEQARNWRIDRMASVDRNVLRLGSYELMHTDAPVPVVIDEAVELAHRFGGDRSPAFVNGVLDALASRIRPAEAHGR